MKSLETALFRVSWEASLASRDGDDVLIVKGATQTFNPTLSDETIAAQRAADPTGAVSEWDAEFRDDLVTFLDDRVLDAAIEYGRPLELPPKSVSSKAFADASGGGTGGDVYSIAIGHKEDGLFLVDVVRGTPGPFDPYAVTKEYAALLKQYRITSVTGDRWGKEWVQSAWRNTGISYTQSPLAKSDIYLECLPLFTRGLVRLPDHNKLLRELRLLERQCHRGGKESVDHGKNGSDDYANAVCGVLRSLSGSGYRLDVFDPNFQDEDTRPPSQPQAEPVQANGNWWKSRPRSATTIPSADENLRRMYGALDTGFRTGYFKDE